MTQGNIGNTPAKLYMIIDSSQQLEDKWTAPDNIDQLIETEVDLGQYGLHFQHFVVAENAYGKEWLAKIDNIIATLFLAEAHYDLPLLLEKLLILYDTEHDRQALMLFINWFRQLAAHGRLKNADFAQIEEQDLTREEVKSMLIKALERERETIRQEGFDSGKKEGIQERNRQIAQAMIANGFPPPTIAALLNLSVSAVEQLILNFCAKLAGYQRNPGCKQMANR